MKRPFLDFVFGASLLAGIALFLAVADDCFAEVIASDSASDPAYNDGWQGLKGAVEEETGTDNGGNGFLPWSFDDTFWEAESSPYSQPHFIDTKAGSFNNLGVPAFALTNGNVAFNGYTTTVTRPFAAALKVGDQISVDVDNPVMRPLEEGDSVGFIISLRTAEKEERFGFYTTLAFNDDQWTITDSRGEETASGLSDEASSGGFKLTLQLTGEETYRLTITPRGGGDPLTVQGNLAKPGSGEIDRIQFVMFGNGSGDGADLASGEREFYFNNLLIESSASQPVQRPSDCNQDGSLNIADVICFLGQVQGIPAALPCEGGSSGPGNIALLDANGDAKLDVQDALSVLQYLFMAAAPPALGATCQPLAGCPDNSAKCR